MVDVVDNCECIINRWLALPGEKAEDEGFRKKDIRSLISRRDQDINHNSPLHNKLTTFPLSFLRLFLLFPFSIFQFPWSNCILLSP